MKIKYLSWVPAFLMMLIVFNFSSKPAVVSGESSLAITDYIMKVYERITDVHYEESERMEKLLILDYYVRKTAHVTEYAILAAAVAFPLWIRKRNGFGLWRLSVLITAGYAATDEFHQRFVPGRSGELKDVLIDSLGAVLGALLFLVIAAALDRRKDKRRKSVRPSE
jgi:VanZ family protein